MTTMQLRQAVVLVGGLGTRLWPATQKMPKPLLDIGGRPFLDYLLADLVRQGIADILLLAGYLGEQVAERYHGLRIGGVRLAVVIETAPAGTAGALVGARDLLASHFVLMNGDTLFDAGIAALAAMPVADPWLVRIALRRVGDGERYGNVILRGNQITAFRDKVASRGPALIHGGIAIVDRELLAKIGLPPVSLECDVLPALAREGLVYGKQFDGYFIDIGVPDTLAQAMLDLPGRPVLKMPRAV